jgi:uncharacterized protein (TIGR00299 family) protein
MHLHLDCFSGIAGDMMLGALIDLGAAPDAVEQQLRKLDLADWSIDFPRIDAGHAIVGTGVHVHDNAHHHDHDDHHHHGHRHYVDIVALIDGAGLPPQVARRAQAVFARIAEAEAKVHGLSIDDVHFHEVGAVDSIVDIVGVAIALELLRVDTISASQVPLGSGFTESQHGRIPVPVPATLECLRGIPCYDSGLKVELVTPTGAGILAALATEFGPMPAMSPDRIGYGAGARKHADRPNVLRAILGRRGSIAGLTSDPVWEIAANLDDQTPEEVAHAVDQLWAAGVLDVWLTPLIMKKGRQGQCLSVLCRPDQKADVIRTILRETTTLGVRMATRERAILDRETVPIQTPYGEIRFKVGRGSDGEIWNLAPEADDCVRAAEASGVPLKMVRQVAIAEAVKRLLE